MKSDQKGFSAVTILAIIITVGLIGAVGWLVYDRQQSKKNSNSKPSASTVTPNPNEKIADSGREITSSEWGYMFSIPEGWKETVRLDSKGEGGRNGELIPPGINNAGQILFQSGKNVDNFTLETYKSAAPDGKTIKGKNTEGWLHYETKIDPRINSLEIFFVSNNHIYRFGYEVKKEYSDPKTIPFYEDFIETAQTFQVTM